MSRYDSVTWRLDRVQDVAHAYRHDASHIVCRWRIPARGEVVRHRGYYLCGQCRDVLDALNETQPRQTVV